MNLTHLECALCGTEHDATKLQNLCVRCAKPLLARYDFERVAQTLTKENLKGRRADMWRYAEVLPVETQATRVMPSNFACVAPQVIPLSLNEPVGLKP